MIVLSAKVPIVGDNCREVLLSAELRILVTGSDCGHVDWCGLRGICYIAITFKNCDYGKLQLSREFV